MSLNGVTINTPYNIPLGAGVYFELGDAELFNPLVAPTLEQIMAGMKGATQEGGTLTITPELWKPELDDVTVDLYELDAKLGETAQMEVSFAELTPELVKRFVIGKVQDSTDANYDVITSADLGPGHYYECFGQYGRFLNGRPYIVLFKRALCTSGMAVDSKSKTNSVFKGTFVCKGDIGFGTNKLPYAIFLYKKDKWVPATPEEAQAAAE